MSAHGARPGVIRVGHKGADAVVPGNTPASFDAAVEHGVDMIEFDVLPVDPHAPATSPLVMAHDYGHDLTAAPDLETGLAHLAGPAFGAVTFDVDLKLPGYEDRVADALRRHGLVARSLVTSTYMRSLVAMRAAEPAVRLGWSVPRARRDYTRSALWMVPAYGALHVLRRRVPERAAAHLRAGRCEAIMANWHMVTPALVRAVADAGGELYVWTVDDAARIRRLAELGVTGVISNDPRLFGAREDAYAMRQVAAE